MRLALTCGLLMILAACANPLNRVTYQDYKKQGGRAEAQGDWATAEMAYYRAAENVRMGNLEPAYQSTSLFDLGRAKRKVGELDESEDLLKQALAIDERLYGLDGYCTSFTISELAGTYWAAGKLNEGVPLMIRLEPLLKKHSDKYSDQARRFIKQIYQKYADEIGSRPEAEKFRKVAASL